MKKTLIYIIGAGRSGTTLFDIVLGNTSDSISLGEINRFFKRDGIPPKRKEDSDVYLFWKKIRQTFERLSNTKSYAEYDSLFQKNEFHSNILKSFLKTNDLNYQKDLNDLYKAIALNVDEKIIIESSKYPARALNLSNYLNKEDIAIKYIYLKKDPVKVVKSFNKKDIEQPSKNFLMANIYYLVVNTICSIVIKVLKRRGHHTFCFKSEDFLKHPETVLKAAEKALNEDFSESQNQILNNRPLYTGFLFDGNRIRLKETLFLQPYKNNTKKNLKYYFTRVFNYIVYR
ncbi:hypothetical protein ACFS5M_02460 [Lacinutrix iliipiscaria]|uniref:Sulfotransferase family protein n=1 Tax=Lacinutrix iliipiscaria TaxID=1230532 RepID=A0ABW5WJU9_9FLAO